ncbi:MAG: peptidase M61 [Reichenbachiella sp.]
MKKYFFGILMSSFSLSLFAQSEYKVTIDLTNVVDDKVKVTYTLLPEIDQDEIEFHIPKIVPGTYSIYDFGRFLSDFKALDAKEQPLEIDSISQNRILIKGAKNLTSISYWVEDSYDTNKENVIFEPAGTNIEEGKNFVLNTFGFAGYLNGMKDLPFDLKIKHPTKMFGASALNKSIQNDSIDVYNTKNYFDLADGPIMYCEPDTVTFNVGGADILISTYSPNDVLSSEFIKEQVIETLNAQKTYLGDTLPVDKYAFIVYLFNGRSMSGGFGALEHSYSSFYSMPEMNPSFLTQSIRDISAHEFFHIVTPLNIHSEEIGNFDFIEPKMSKHLWLYEGVTEYAAHLAQVKYGSMGFPDFLEVIRGKIGDSKKYNDTLPFTEMSKGCLKETKDQYPNVYQKGALIGMALDIRLRELSNGEYGVQELMNDLALEYGKSKSFKDEELFDKITSLTFPEIRSFFALYVEGSVPIPYQEILKKVGVIYTPPIKKKELSLGHISFSVNDEDNRLIIQSIDAMNTFGKEMGYKEGDIIVKFDGVDIDIENYEEEFAAFKERHKKGDEIVALVLREDKKGKRKKKKLSANAIEVEVKSKAYMEIEFNATEQQEAIRKAWANK